MPTYIALIPRQSGPPDGPDNFGPTIVHYFQLKLHYYYYYYYYTYHFCTGYWQLYIWKKSRFLEYTALQLFRSYKLWHLQCNFSCWMFLYLPKHCAVSNVAFCRVPSVHAFPKCCSRVFWLSEMVPAAPVIAGITFVFTFHTRCMSRVRSLSYTNFTDSFLTSSVPWNRDLKTSINPLKTKRICVI